MLIDFMIYKVFYVLCIMKIFGNGFWELMKYDSDFVFNN